MTVFLMTMNMFLTMPLLFRMEGVLTMPMPRSPGHIHKQGQTLQNR